MNSELMRSQMYVDVASTEYSYLVLLSCRIPCLLFRLPMALVSILWSSFLNMKWTCYRIVIASCMPDVFMFFLFISCLASCYNCNKSGHIARDCPESGSKSCYNCGKSGHISRECDAPDNRGSGGGGGRGGGGGGGYGGQSRDVRSLIFANFFTNR